ncbi:class I SAM-dependent methyltransferase [Paucibacter sp. PLA-PC-4]|uniref:class I SAM-dependent methyltransferase n=1 Tax=Paucibacter sp. PLA-PC-4 TaxID=2993655 RepID=UPI00224B90DC|nr:class I SAM-dependent methyltransferase [Paucibacter sp. PLA-PC-4]MCX2863839.1 class I SAM-dependent methyltransferase [Paucibacter sp. PLA-PC-4]
MPSPMAALHRLSAWPLPALLSWGAAWLLFLALARLGLGPLPAALGAGLAGLLLALTQASRWRRVMVALGFPLSLLISGAASGLPAWAWLLPLLLLALAYPQRLWRDAPLYPTPQGALQALAEIAPLCNGARVLDAGCGLGHGLRELRRVYPQARIEGVEWSALLARLAAWSCPWAKVRRGDMWADDWGAYDLIYLFQRPESMPQAFAKMREQLRPNAWLVSLDFELPALQARACIELGGRHRLWVYAPGAAQERAARADMTSN